MRKVDRRLDRMIEIADQLDVPLDHVVEHMGRVPYSTFKAYSDNPSLLPRYMKSKVTPYASQSISAESTVMRRVPDSQLL